MRIPASAVWIGSDHPFDLHETYLNFRKDVVIDSQPQQAMLSITADSRYKLWINGTYVGRGPSRCWPHAQQVDEIDVARHLVDGKNAIAVQVYSPGYSHFAYVHRGACGLLAWLEADGRMLMVSDTSWRVQRDLSWSSDAKRISIYGSGVERRNMALAADWLQVSTASPDWKTPRIVAQAEGPVWTNLQRRDVPLLVDKSACSAREAIRVMRGQAVALPGDPHDAFRQAWNIAQPIAKSHASYRLAVSEYEIRTYDLGSSYTGCASLHIAGAKGGERLLVNYSEKRRDGNLVISDPATYCHMRPTDEFVLCAGDQTVETFSQRGGRYISICLHAPAAAEVNIEFSFVAARYPLQERGSKPIASGMQAIASLCQRTLLACLQDGFVDSVWRESSQWLGDCVAQAFALQAISDDVRPLRRAITMAAEGAYPDGMLPSVLPGEVHAYTVLDYNFSWVELLRMYVEHPAASDREELLSALWPVLCKMLERFDADKNADGLIMSQPGRRLFLDWSPVDRHEPNLTYNGRYLLALQLASKLAHWAKEVHSASIWQARAGRLRTSMIAAFRHDDQWRENGYGTPASQLGLALVLLTDCVDAPDVQRLCQCIIARSLDLSDEHEEGELVLASPFMHHYVFQALDNLGYQQAILDIIRARWGRWAEAGETTCWENWSIDFPDGSACHGFSAHPLGWITRCQDSLNR
jgi:hypothetical protein